jgi:hypothetical protein
VYDEQMERPIDDVLREFARPFVVAGWSDRAALDAAAAIWDLVNAGLTTEQIVARLDEDGSAHTTKLVEAFVARKRALFGSDHRYSADAR